MIIPMVVVLKLLSTQEHLEVKQPNLNNLKFEHVLTVY
jgi:hypothetical protein